MRPGVEEPCGTRWISTPNVLSQQASQPGSQYQHSHLPMQRWEIWLRAVHVRGLTPHRLGKGRAGTHFNESPASRAASPSPGSAFCLGWLSSDGEVPAVPAQSQGRSRRLGRGTACPPHADTAPHPARSALHPPGPQPQGCSGRSPLPAPWPAWEYKLHVVEDEDGQLGKTTGGPRACLCSPCSSGLCCCQGGKAEPGVASKLFRAVAALAPGTPGSLPELARRHSCENRCAGPGCCQSPSWPFSSAGHSLQARGVRFECLRRWQSSAGSSVQCCGVRGGPQGVTGSLSCVPTAHGLESFQWMFCRNEDGIGGLDVVLLCSLKMRIQTDCSSTALPQESRINYAIHK